MISTRFEPFYVVDTHALIWYLLNNKKLSPTARMIFQAAEQNQTILIIPAIVVAELYYSNAKNNWFADFISLYTDLISKPFIQFIPFEHLHVPNFSQDAIIPEMHDRMIAGAARRIGAPLITSDPLIVNSRIVTTVW